MNHDSLMGSNWDSKSDQSPFFQLPTLAQENFQAAAARWEGGNYGTRRGIQYLGTQRHREVEAMLERGEIQNREEYYAELSQRPKEWQIWVKHLDTPPSGYLESVHGKFPSDGE